MRLVLLLMAIIQLMACTVQKITYTSHTTSVFRNLAPNTVTRGPRALASQNFRGSIRVSGEMIVGKEQRSYHLIFYVTPLYMNLLPEGLRSDDADDYIILTTKDGQIITLKEDSDNWLKVTPNEEMRFHTTLSSDQLQTLANSNITNIKLRNLKKIDLQVKEKREEVIKKMVNELLNYKR